MAYSQSPIPEVIPGPQKERFTDDGIQTFLNSEYTLSKSFDRMGYRLEGRPITHLSSADLISEGNKTIADLVADVNRALAAAVPSGGGAVVDLSNRIVARNEGSRIVLSAIDANIWSFQMQSANSITVDELGFDDAGVAGVTLTGTNQIGNPFGHENTMTVGFVSAIGRSFPADGGTTGVSYSIPDVIQTDAPINPGNSGGVLVDDQGRLMGVTAQIESPVRASVGIGYVIPSNIKPEAYALVEPIFKAIDSLIGHLAKITQTPMHYLRTSGDMPSGEALKTAESGLIKKCYARQKQWGATWSYAMTFALEISTKAKPENPVYPVWKSPETRHDLEQAQTAQLKSILGIPLAHLWTEHFGYSKELVEEFEEKNKALAASVLAQVVAQVGQLPPGSEAVTANPQQLIDLVKASGAVEPKADGESGLDISQILAMLPKSTTGQTTAGEATAKPQPNSRPPASPTRRITGFKD